MLGLLIINCAGDTQLAHSIYTYISDRIDNCHTFVSIKEDEIEIDRAELKLTDEEVKMLLDSFLQSNPELEGYKVIKFENIYTVGIPPENAKLELLTCEMCGYTTPFYEELYAHRWAHGI